MNQNYQALPLPNQIPHVWIVCPRVAPFKIEKAGCVNLMMVFIFDGSDPFRGYLGCKTKRVLRPVIEDDISRLCLSFFFFWVFVLSYQRSEVRAGERNGISC